LRFEAENVFDRDPIQMTADSPSGENFRADEFVDRSATELPTATQLRYRQKGRTDAPAEAMIRRRETDFLCYGPPYLTSAINLSPHRDRISPAQAYAAQVPSSAIECRRVLKADLHGAPRGG